MIALCRIKYVDWHHWRLDLSLQLAGHCRFDFFDDPSLSFIVEPDCRHILTTESWPQRIVIIPEEVDHFFEADHVRIEVDLQRFRVISQTVIGRELLITARVADAGSIYAIDDPKLGVWSPESAKGKRC